MSVLIVLVERHDWVVSKSELYELVWTKLFVEENNLMVQISTLRKALGHDLIATIPGRGYQIRAVVRRIGGAEQRASTIAPPTADQSGLGIATNLPHRLEPLLGRSDELIDLCDLVREHRLVTIAGPSGVGKTRLAAEVGWQIAASFPDGVWLADLVPAGDADAVASAVALPLQVKLSDDIAPAAAIASAIGGRRLLLILDNCEHVAKDVAALISVLLQRTPNLAVLATSQDVLYVPSEQVYRLGPLALPHAVDSDIGRFGAVELFAARARAADRSFMLTEQNAETVGDICRRLDGNPLALEMAAARLPHLGINGLLAALREPFVLRSGRHSIAGGRYRTLHDMVAWSYDLLDDADKPIFRRLGVFRGSFSLAAAIDVAGSADDDRWDTVDALGRLVDKSLVAAISTAEPRYRLFETTRFFAIEQLEASGEGEDTVKRHAAYFAELCDRADQSRESTPPEVWEQLYRPEIDNIRSALDWTLAEPARAEIAIALAGSSALLWDRVELIAEGRRFCDRALGLLTGDSNQPKAATLLKGAGAIWREGDRDRSTDLLEQSASLYRQIDDELGLGGVLAILGGNYDYLGRFEDAKSALEEAAALLATGDRPKSLWTVLNESGSLALHLDDLDGARQHYGQALDLARRIEDPLRETVARINLAELEFRSGAFSEAIAHAQAAVDGLRAAGQDAYLARGLVNLGAYLILTGDASRAKQYIRDALPLLKEKGGSWLSLCFLQAAAIASYEGHREAAIAIRRYAERHYEQTREIRQPLFLQISALLEQQALPASHDPSTVEPAWSDDLAVTFTSRYLALHFQAAAQLDF